jgi:hypothetical protein
MRAWANLPAKILEITLYTTLQKDIGLKSLAEVTFADFGT